VRITAAGITIVNESKAAKDKYHCWGATEAVFLWVRELRSSKTLTKAADLWFDFFYQHLQGGSSGLPATVARSSEYNWCLLHYSWYSSPKVCGLVI